MRKPRKRGYKVVSATVEYPEGVETPFKILGNRNGVHYLNIPAGAEFWINVCTVERKWT